jgi:hypothetical protein
MLIAWANTNAILKWKKSSKLVYPHEEQFMNSRLFVKLSDTGLKVAWSRVRIPPMQCSRPRVLHFGDSFHTLHQLRVPRTVEWYVVGLRWEEYGSGCDQNEGIFPFSRLQNLKKKAKNFNHDSRSPISVLSELKSRYRCANLLNSGVLFPIR